MLKTLFLLKGCVKVAVRWRKGSVIDKRTGLQSTHGISDHNDIAGFSFCELKSFLFFFVFFFKKKSGVGHFVINIP